MYRTAQLLTLVFVASSLTPAIGQTCIATEPPTPNCSAARVIPGFQGHHVVMMDVSTSTATSSQCGISTGHNVWFEVTPFVSGPMTITTCHPATQFDTVLAVYSGGDSGCNSMTLEGCNDDDSFGEGCTSGCSPSPRSSTVVVQASAGTRYRIVVGSYGGSISPPCAPCLGLRVTIGAPCGDPPNNLAPTLAKELPGTPGVYTAEIDVTDAVKLASEPNPACVGPTIGHSVWFRVTPAQDGYLTFTTCDLLTSYDTVVALYQDAGGGILVSLDCSDDDPDASCINTCDPTPRGSTVMGSVEAGITYLIQVGSYGNNVSGCPVPLCLGVVLTLQDLCEFDTTAPEITLTAPPELTGGCVCPSVPIAGYAHDPDGVFESWRLEYRPVGTASWNLIQSSTSEVSPPGGTLANWNTSGVSQGYYVLRLTARNVCGRASAQERVVWFDNVFDSLSFGPAHGTVVGGTVCLTGTVIDNFCFDYYVADYRPVGGGAFQPVDPGNPIYTSGVINSTLAVWNSLLLPDGDYEMRVAGETRCGDGASMTLVLRVDNTAPTVHIAAPLDCTIVDGVVQIIGTIQDANLAGWSLYVTGGGLNTWSLLNSGAGSVNNGVLANWNVSGLPSCSYTLRLVASDAAQRNCNNVVHNTAEYLVSVHVGTTGGDCPEDIDGSGVVDLTDLALLLSAYGTSCP